MSQTAPKSPKKPRQPMSKTARLLVVVASMIAALLLVVIIGVVTTPQDSGEPQGAPTPVPTETITAPETEPSESQRPRPTTPNNSGGNTPAPSPSDETVPPTTSPETGTGYSVVEILALLAGATVISSVDNAGYDRDLFGSGWLDTDGNGCDARNDILLRDLIDITLDADGCRVLSGTLIDSYTGETIPFLRGQQTSSDVQIDHMVPLSRAWALGASEWSDDTRREFANDPANLFAVKGEANNNKSDQGIDTWTPAIYDCILVERAGGASASQANMSCGSNPNLYGGEFYTAFECEYAARYVIVTDKYSLAVTQADIARVTAALATC